MDFTFKKSPFNLDLLVLNRSQTKLMTPVTKLNIFEPSSSNFDPNGLFSTEIFGPVGSEERNTTYSYVNLRAGVLHPLVYRHIITTKLFYKDVIAGKKYAVYDEELKDLVPSIEEEGRTGYNFFIETLEKIELSDNDSDLRMFKIFMIANFAKPDFLLKDFLIIPAGLRDYTINANGQPEEDDINDLYRKLIILSNSLSNITLNKDTVATIDSVRFRMQEAVLEIYEYIMSLIDGKRKFIQAKWGSRGIMFGTRNVITPSLANISDLDSSMNISIEHTTIGLFQYARSITPITMNRLHSVFISKIFSPDTSNAMLVNPKTLRTELSAVNIKARDLWLTTDGLDELLGTMGQDELRSEPIMVGDKYLLLVHDNGNTITPVFNTDMMPEEFKENNLRPITYYELLYMALIDTFGKYRCLITRYPVINLGGIYPGKIYVKTTNNPRKVKVKLGMIEHECIDYPNFKESYYNSLSPHYAFLDSLGGDYDGDKVSFTAVIVEDSIKEIDKLMSRKEFYLSPDNKLVFSPETGTLNYVVTALDKGVIYS